MSDKEMTFTEWCKVMESEDGEFHAIPYMFKLSMFSEYLEVKRSHSDE